MMLPQVIDAIESARTTLLFTNVRSQAEIWFQQILKARPDLIGQIALHHGSIDRDIRVKSKICCAAATSSAWCAHRVWISEWISRRTIR
jgi:hypothetical protein